MILLVKIIAIVQSFCNTYKGDLLAGRARLVTGQTNHRAALYTSSATLGASTAAYTASNEVSGTGYTAKGELLVIPASVPSSGTGQSVAFADFTDVTWSTSTITSRGSLIYDDAATSPTVDASLIVLDFGSDKTSSSGDFTIQFPVAATGTAIIRVA